MIFTKPLLGLLGFAGVLTIASGAFAAWQTAQLKTQRDLAESRKEIISTLSGSIEEIKRAHQAELDARKDAAAAHERTLDALDRQIIAAEDALSDRRQNDATLDLCFNYDPGIDITGGLLRHKGSSRP